MTTIGPIGFSVGGLTFNGANGALYGSSQTGEIYTISTWTGAGSLVGASGWARIEGLAYNDNSNTMYGVTSTNELITINTLTGAGSLVGAIGFTTVYGLAYDDNTDTLYGATVVLDELITIDTGTGAGSLVGSLGAVSMNGLAFDYMGWETELVDTFGDTGNYSSIGVSADGTVHILYHDEDDASVNYASSTDANIGYIWTKEVVEYGNANVHPGHGTGLVVGNDGVIRIAYAGYPNPLTQLESGEIRFGAGSFGAWNLETIFTDQNAIANGPLDMAMGADGGIHIAWSDSDKNLMYAGNPGGWAQEWSVEDTKEDLDGSGGFSIAVNPLTNRPTIAYYGTDDQGTVVGPNQVFQERLDMADISFQVWRAPYTARHPNTVGAWTQIADVSGLSYTDMTAERGTRYYYSVVPVIGGIEGEASEALRGWLLDNEVILEDAADSNTVVVDGAGVVHIFADSTVDDQLWHIWGNEGAWNREPVSSAKIGCCEEEPMEALIVDSTIHLFYQSYDDASYHMEIHHAWSSGGLWSTEVVATPPGGGGITYESPRADLDSGGIIHLGWVDATNGDIWYAFGSTGAWTSEIVDDGLIFDGSGNFMGGFEGIALIVDGSDAPHLFYSDETADFLYHAVRSGGGIWSRDLVDDGDGGLDFVAETIDVAIDASGTFYIAHHQDGGSGTTDENLRISYGTPGLWSNEVIHYEDMFPVWVNIEDDIGEDDISIILDDSGDIHLFYNFDDLTDDEWLGHAWGSPGNTRAHHSGTAGWVYGQDWNYEPVVEGGMKTGACDWGYSNSVAKGPDGALHLVFSEDCNETIRYMRISP